MTATSTVTSNAPLTLKQCYTDPVGTGACAHVSLEFASAEFHTLVSIRGCGENRAVAASRKMRG